MSTEKKIVIAIDGYSSCGKSTFAKVIAKELNYIYIDSGAMYRAITLFSLRKGLINKNIIDEAQLQSNINNISIEFRVNTDKTKKELFLNGENVEEEIRGLEVANNVSAISAIKFVRTRMVELQRQMGTLKGVVMDGRDIGTAVFPNAELKIFMTADPMVRAKRRYDELTAKGQHVSLDEIKKNIEQRDLMDTTRKESPLEKADDALILDNSYMTPEEQMVWVREHINNAIMANK